MSTQHKSQSTKTSAIGSPYVFPKSEASWPTEFFQKHASAALERRLASVRAEFVCNLYRNISHTESPLEAAFVAAWMALEEWDHSAIAWRSQHAVEVDGHGYRLDFVFEPQAHGWFASLIGPQCPKIALELDGHEFHEKTKEQVTQRNRRDRDLQSEGWTILHVSGSEFNRSPEVVVRELYQRVFGMFCAARDAQGSTV